MRYHGLDQMLMRFGAAGLLALGLSPWTSALAQSCACDVSLTQEHAADALLNLTAAQRATSAATHLPYGIPTPPANATNESLFYSLEYIANDDADLRVPTWVAYRLRNADVQVRRARTECFRHDPRLSASQGAICQDYQEPIFDRGHMVPSGDMTRSLNAMLNTYVFTNMTPQYGPFNQKIWATLEQYVRDWTAARDPLYVISGAIYDRDRNGQRDPDSAAQRVQNTAQGMARLAIATDFYKIILYQRPTTGFIEVMALILPHNQQVIEGTPASDAYLRAHLTTIDDIEARTGINFLPDLEATNPAKARAVEASLATTLWPHN